MNNNNIKGDSLLHLTRIFMAGIRAGERFSTRQHLQSTTNSPSQTGDLQ
ncbi:MAG TPA: hypothetical protein VJ698_18505 [Noviherbaspirillum sp.]|nr:hypothetical protein [Noviherbaspirillum sp.]HJV87467.1 hypothetical protein [Noviherbaspirillum sp.]